MAIKSLMVGLIVVPLFLTACSKQEKAPASHETAASESVTEAAQTSVEQQAAIDALDKPVQDEKNTDISASVANAPADAVTAEESK